MNPLCREDSARGLFATVWRNCWEIPSRSLWTFCGEGTVRSFEESEKLTNVLFLATNVLDRVMSISNILGEFLE